MRMVAIPLCVFAAAAAFLLGYFFGYSTPAKSPQFHDMAVNQVLDYTRLIDPADPAVADLAAKLGSPEKAYYFVRDEIAFDPSRPSFSPAVVVAESRGSCLGKTLLLCSLYRAMGIPADEVRMRLNLLPIQRCPRFFSKV